MNVLTVLFAEISCESGSVDIGVFSLAFLLIFLHVSAHPTCTCLLSGMMLHPQLWCIINDDIDVCNCNSKNNCYDNDK